MGHEKVYVLEEGFSAWQQKGYLVNVLIYKLRIFFDKILVIFRENRCFA